MASNYVLDPSTGIPMLQTPNGPGLPLPLSPQQMQQAGSMPMPDPNALGPNPYGGLPPEAVAGPGGGPVSARDADINDFKQTMGKVGSWLTTPMGGGYRQPNAAPGVPPPPGPPGPPGAPAGASYKNPYAAPAPQNATPVAQPPAEKKGPKLAEPKEDKSASSEEGGEPALDPDVAAAIREASGGGGGGGGHMGVTSEKRKFSLSGPVDPELAGSIKKGTAELDDAEAKRVDDRASAEQRLWAAHQAEEQVRLDDLAAERERRSAVDSERARLQNVRTMRERDAASLKAPQVEEYWKDKGMGAQIATAIAAVCGGWLQGYRGGSNPGIDLMNQNIERWIASQKEEYERARGRVTDADNHYKQALDIYGTPAQAEADLRARTYAVRDQQLRIAANQIGTEDAQKNAQLAISTGQLQRQQAQAAGQAAAKVEVEQNIGWQGNGGGGGSVLRGLEAGARAKKAKATILGEDQKGQPDTAVRFSDGTVTYARDANEAGDLQKQNHAGEEVREAMTRLKGLTATLASRTAGADDKATAEVEVKLLMPKIHEFMKVPGFKDSVLHLIEGVTGDPQNFARNPNTVARLDAIIKQTYLQEESNKKWTSPRPGTHTSAATPRAPSAQDVDE